MKLSRFIYAGAAWLFVVGVIAQVFLAGLVVVARQTDWEGHIGLGHGLGLPLLVMLVAMYIAKLPASAKRLTWALFAVYFIQADVIIFMRDEFPFVSAFHPVLALIDFALGWLLARRSLEYVRETRGAVATAAAD